MKKIVLGALVASTMLSGVAHATYATNYSSAQEVRDSLTTVYDELHGALGTTGSFGASEAGNEYAELLFRIDNLGDFSPIVLELDPITGHVSYSGGEFDGLFTLEEVLEQVDTFTDQLNTDMFGNTDGTTSLTGTSGGDYGQGVEATSGLAKDVLDEIIAAANNYNEKLTNSTATKADKEQALADYEAVWATHSNPFNNAVDALADVAESMAELSFCADETSGGSVDHFQAIDGSCTSFTLSGAVNAGETVTVDDVAEDIFRIIENGKIYTSYTNYVAGISTYVTTDLTFTLGSNTPNNVSIPVIWNATQWSATTIEMTIDGTVYRIGANFNDGGVVTNFRVWAVGDTADLFESSNWNDIINYIDTQIAGN